MEEHTEGTSDPNMTDPTASPDDVEEAEQEEPETEGFGQRWEPMDSNQVLPSLLLAIRNQRLIVFCGAGLSMGDPSNLPSAAQMVENLVRRYRLDTGGDLTACVDEDIEEIAHWALQNGSMFQDFFLDTLRTRDFMHPPNVGHMALADLMLTNAVRGAISTNVDCLIEAAAEELGEHDFRAIVAESDLARTPEYSQLIKLHGCFRREEQHTVWHRDQLQSPPINDRIAAFEQRMSVDLRGCSLLMIGFWTDWPYLNDTLISSLEDLNPRTLTLVNPDDPAGLQEKAPDLFNWLGGNQDVHLYYVRSFGNEFMNSFWRQFSKSVFRRLQGKVDENDSTNDYYQKSLRGSSQPPPIDDMSCDEIYGLRRDFSGVPDSECVRENELAEAHHERMGAMHSILLDREAQMNGRVYEVGDKAFRLLNGRGEPSTRVYKRFKDHVPNERGVDACVTVAASGVPVGKNRHRQGGLRG